MPSQLLFNAACLNTPRPRACACFMSHCTAQAGGGWELSACSAALALQTHHSSETHRQGAQGRAVRVSAHQAGGGTRIPDGWGQAGGLGLAPPVAAAL